MQTRALALCLLVACSGKSSSEKAGSAAGSAAVPEVTKPAVKAGSGAGSGKAGSGSNAPVDPKAQTAYRAAMKKGREATAKKQWADAIAGFDAALKAKPGDSRATGERGFARLLEGTDLAAAEKDFDRAASSTKDQKILASIWFNRGLLEEKQGQADNALAAFATSNVLRPTPAAAKKLGGKAACPMMVDRDESKGQATQDFADWATLAEKLPHDSEYDWNAARWISDTTKDPMPTVFRLDDGGETHAYLAWQPKGAKGVRVLPLYAASLGRCPGTAYYEVAESAGGRVHLHGVELYEGGYTFMCTGGKAGADDLHECADDPNEEPSGTACFGGPPNLRDLIIDDTGKVVMQLEQAGEPDQTGNEPTSKIAKVEMTADAVKISGLGCDRAEPIVAPTGTSAAGSATSAGSGSGSAAQGK
ncbi:MAG TPA: hypothetical protein VGM90_00025 [Kofleriaceae bacterium]